MARRRRMSRMSRHSHRRGLRGFLDPVYTGNVSALQVLAGAAVGTVGAGLIKFGLNKIEVQNKAGVKVGLLQAGGPLEVIAPLVPLLTASLAGTALYLVQKKSDMGRAHLVGAVAAGASLTVMDYLKGSQATAKYFSDYVMAPSYANYVMAPSYGVLGENPAQPFAPSYGVLGTNPMVSYDGVIASNPRLAEVTASAMGMMDDRDMADAFAA